MTTPSRRVPTAPLQPEGTLARIRSLLPSLKPSDARVARVILDDPARVPYVTVSELAETAGTAASTVVRCCQRMGFRGFHELKLAVAQELGTGGEVVSGPISAKDSPTELLRKVVAADAEALSEAPATIESGALEQAVRAMARARRILFVGVGTSAPIAQDAAYRFMQIGVRAEAPPDLLVQHLSAGLLGPGDVCFAISHSGATRETVSALRTAAENGATTIALTSFARSPLTETAEISLVAGGQQMSFHLEAMSSRIAHLGVVDALFVAVALREKRRAQRTLDTSGHILSEHRF